MYNVLIFLQMIKNFCFELMLYKMHIHFENNDKILVFRKW